MATNAVGGGAIDAEGFLKFLLHFYRTGYTRALNVTQKAGGANMTVDVNVDSSSYGGALFATTAGVPYFGYTNQPINATVATADPTNPRRDIVVAYIDLSLITTGTTNNLGAFKVKVVTGTAAASPSDPSAVTIQASVGAGYPYVQLARIAVAAAAGSITNAVITDLRTPAANAMPYLYGGPLNTNGHVIPNLADGTVVVTGSAGTVSNAMLAANTAWSNWTPTWTNLTVGNGTVTAKYQQIGKIVKFKVALVLGTTSSISASQVLFSLPVASSSDYLTWETIGHGSLLDNGAASYGLVATWLSTTAAGICVQIATTTIVRHDPLTSSAIAFNSTDGIYIQGFYEAA